MAIDTKAKRASVQAYTFGLVRPPPDGAITAPDRAAAAWIYAGLAYGGVAASDSLAALIGMLLRRNYL